MAQWGRESAGNEAQRGWLGRLSVVLAFVALVLVVVTGGALISLPGDAVEPLSTIVVTAFLIVYCLVAPGLHIVGTALGFIAVAREGDNRLLGVIGILFNVLLFASGALLAWAALQGMAAFT